MMTLLNVADLLAELLDMEEVYAGNIDGNKDSCIGVYSAEKGAHKTAVGGKECTKTKEKRVSILIHHTDDPSAAEQMAQKVLEALTEAAGSETGTCTVRYIRPDEPQYVGRDEHGVCEWVIEALIYYEESEE